MDFDFNKFLHIAVWVLAIGSTLIALAGMGGMYYYYHTLSGRIDLLRMQLKGQVPTYRWMPLIIAIFAWIAVACL
jgi:hypothetical protein